MITGELASKGAAKGRLSFPFVAAGLASVAAVLMLSLLVIETAVDWGRPSLAKGVPWFSAPFLVRTALIAALSFALVAAAWQMRARTAGHREIAEGGRPGPAAWVLLFLPCSLALTFLISPAAFHWLGRPGHSVEDLSAALLFASAGLCLYTALRFRAARVRRVPSLLAASLAACLFLVAGEEVSWFQSLLHTKTPLWLAELNAQHETNFHNINTNVAELVYYSGAFLLLVILPFLKDVGAGFARLSQRPAVREVVAFTPGRMVLFASLPFAAFNYDTWNVTFTQLTFFLACAIAVYYLVSAFQGNTSVSRVHLSLLLTALVGIQILFLIQGGKQVLMWEVREYKELLIPVCLLIYSFELARRPVMQEV